MLPAQNSGSMTASIMANRTKERVVSWVVPLVLGAMLLGLALLQYRWSAQVSESASTRMHASLQSALMNFRGDLERELATMTVEMQSEEDRPVDAAALAERIQLWETTTAQPGFAMNVYLWNRTGLFQLSMSGRRFEPREWPSHLDRVHQKLGAYILAPSPPPSSPHRPRQGDHAAQPPPSEAGPHFRMGAIDQSIPLLIFPATQSGNSGWLLVELSKSVLQTKVFPRLAERYFGSMRNSEYEVRVIEADGSASDVMYASVPGDLKGGEVDADATMNLFGPPIAGRVPSDLRDQDPMEMFRAAPTRLNEPVNDFFSVMRFDPIRYGMDDPTLEITARHREGSVETAVASLRRRNLTISFGVLLVLAASVSLILFNARRARRLAALQMDFVAGVSHELRTPVAAILSAAENIADGVVDNQQQLVRYGNMIKNQAQQLNHLVEQVLRFAATRRDTVSYDVRPLAITVVIDEVLENTAGIVAAAGCKVERNIQPNLPLVAADPGALSQCLQNLITNAVKYGGEARWVGIHTRLDGAASGDVLVTVEDRGIGIDPREIQQIFDPFYRSPAVASSHVHGTGLGLSLARSFAEAMGGRLTVESEVGQGTIFTVRLPVADQHNSRQNSSSGKSA